MLAFILLACTGSSPSIQTVDDVQLTWLGVTSFILQYDDRAILLDAFFSRPKLGEEEGSSEQGKTDFRSAMNRLAIDKLDAVLIGHSHYDHAIDVGMVALESDAVVYGSATTCLIAQAQGLSAERCHIVGQGDEFSIGMMAVEVARTIHWWPEQSGIGGAYGEFTEPPDPDHLFIVPHGGTLSFLLHFPEEVGVPSLFFQDSLGPIDADDSSGEDYENNLQQLFDTRAETTLWLTCVDCAATPEEFQPYLDIIQPKTVFAMHFDGLNPDVADGLQESFQEPDWYRQSLENVGAEGIDPKEYFSQIKIIDGVIHER